MYLAMKSVKGLLTAAILGLCFLFIVPQFAQADRLTSPLLVVGASFENGKTPCILGETNVLGCISINFGEYLSIGNALARSKKNNGRIFVEAIAGATTFDRPGFLGPFGPQAGVGWEQYGYQKQLDRALAATTNPITGTVNAKFVVVGMANDCLHSHAMSVQPADATPCAVVDLDAVVSRYIAVGQQALAAGVTPVFTGYPPLRTPGSIIGIDLSVSQQAYDLVFVIDDANYTALANLYNQRIAAELPDAILVNAWESIVTIGDGLHPDQASVERATRVIMDAIEEYND